MDAVLARRPRGTTDWVDLAARRAGVGAGHDGLLYAVLVLGSLPILVPYLWLFTVAFSGRTGASTVVLWRTLGDPAAGAARLVAPAPRRRRRRRRLRWLELALAAIDARARWPSSPVPISTSTTGGFSGTRISPTR